MPEGVLGLIIVLIICGAVVYVIDHVEIHPTFKMFIRVIAIVAALIYVVRWLASLAIW